MKYLLLCILLQGCTAGLFFFDEEGSRGIPPGIGDPSLALRPLVIVDSAGETLGYIVQFEEDILAILSETGHLYKMYWDGSLFKETIYYTGASCTGETYYATSNKVTSRAVFVDGDGALYVAKNVSNGVGVLNSMTAASYKFPSGTCTAWSSTLAMLPLEAVSNSDVGIPSSIQPPFTIEEN